MSLLNLRPLLCNCFRGDEATLVAVDAGFIGIGLEGFGPFSKGAGMATLFVLVLAMAKHLGIILEFVLKREWQNIKLSAVYLLLGTP